MRARWFLCWHEHELDLSCFVVLRLDWTREPRLKYRFEMDWRLLYRSQTGHTFKRWSNKRYHCIDCVIVMELEMLLFLVVSSCFLFWHFCYWVVSHGTRSQGSFFCRSASSHCQGLWPVIFDKPEVAGCCQLPGLFVLEFQIQTKHGRKPTWPKKRQKPALQLPGFRIWKKRGGSQVGHWFWV